MYLSLKWERPLVSAIQSMLQTHSDVMHAGPARDSLHPIQGEDERAGMQERSYLAAVDVANEHDIWQAYLEHSGSHTDSFAAVSSQVALGDATEGISSVAAVPHQGWGIYNQYYDSEEEQEEEQDQEHELGYLDVGRDGISVPLMPGYYYQSHV